MFIDIIIELGQPVRRKRQAQGDLGISPMCNTIFIELGQPASRKRQAQGDLGTYVY